MGYKKPLIKLPKLDLSKYNDSDRLPSNIYNIIKNALPVFSGSTKKVANHYNLNEDIVIMVFEENYLNICQIIDSQSKSKELDEGLQNSIKLMTDHINTLENTKVNKIMRSETVAQVTRMTDRLLSAKEQYNKTFDTLVNNFNAYTLKQKQLEILEQGKLEDKSDYDENVETIFSKLRSTVSRKIKATNVITKEVKHYGSITEVAVDLKCNGDTIRKRLADKTLFRDTWAFEEE